MFIRLLQIFWRLTGQILFYVVHSWSGFCTCSNCCSWLLLCIFLPRVCRTLVPEIRIRLEMLHVFWYIEEPMCVILQLHACTRLNSKDDWSYVLVSAMKIIDEDRQVNAQTHGICPATCQHTYVNQKQPMDNCTLLFCEVYIDMHRRNTELTTVPACCLWMQSRADQQCRDISAGYVPFVTINYNQLRLAPQDSLNALVVHGRFIRPCLVNSW